MHVSIIIGLRSTWNKFTIAKNTLMVTSSSSLALGDEAKLSCSAYYSIKMFSQIPSGGTFNQGYMVYHALKKLAIRLVISCGFNWAVGILLT